MSGTAGYEILNQAEEREFSLETNRIYQPGYSELEEPGWGLRHRISNWANRFQSSSGYQRIPLEEHLSHAESVEIPIEEETSFSISIPESSETLPLLPGTSAAAGTATGIAGTAVTAGQAGVALAGAATVAAGGVIGWIASKFQNDGAVLPHHDFIGPGNPISDKEGVDKDDQIAKEHDIKYQEAKTQDDIKKADQDAIAKFQADYNINGNLHSWLGATGLGLKSAIEHKFGVLYPNLPTIFPGTYHFILCLKTNLLMLEESVMLMNNKC